MATFRMTEGGVRLSTTFAYKKVKAIPDLGLHALQRDHSSDAAGTQTDQPDSEERTNESCFVTKRPCYTLERAHFINAVKKRSDEKTKVEGYLSICGIVPDRFNLNSPSNIVPLDRTLHHSFDQLGFLIFTCSENTLSTLADLVESENEKYDKLGISRCFDFNNAPLSDAEFEMVLLHPNHLLPKGSTIAMHTLHRSADNTERLIGKLYMIAKDGALREGLDPTSPRFPAFCHTRTENHINPFLVILNAEIAIRRFKRSGDYFNSLCTEYKDLITQTMHLADLLYHPPIVDHAVKTLHLADQAGGAGGTGDGAPEGENEDEDGSGTNAS
ncbi:hypothetical protein DFP72DRAFT_1071557 [Ephemerocybe angulata]|uniref:Uncharacterized protein n=1 Tax=Ephemerocybe angulata TaxID=980116 RepID=A0A8H6HS02_9AGAR|nr:hypothetical protein DFP72DRAFT_1071557 [Tulosesus angulatus]